MQVVYVYAYTIATEIRILAPFPDYSLTPPGRGGGRGSELVLPNPKLRLMDQVREVLRVKHHAIRTEQAYCDWVAS